MTRDQIAALKTFCRGIMTQAWTATLDSADAQALAEETGVIVESVATQEDITQGFDGEVGDPYYRLAAWLE